MFESTQHFGQETYRVIVLESMGRDLCFIATSAGYCLPSVDIPSQQRVAENLAAAMRSTWDCDVVCLFEPDLHSSVAADSGVHYQLVELSGVRPPQMVPVPVSSLSRHCFRDVADYVALGVALSQCERAACSPHEAPFARIGWLSQLCEWIEAAIHPLTLKPDVAIRQLNASPTFSLIRFETSGPPVWFKAVGAPNKRELPITLTLARLFPRHVPRVLATRPEWNGWLSEEVPGGNLGDSQDVVHWVTTSVSLAQLQIESLDAQCQLLDAGARDFRVPVLLDIVGPLLDVMAALMAKQTKAFPDPLTRQEVLALKDPIFDALRELQTLAVPDALGHLDLNPGNVIVSPKACRFLDWSEAYLGHPFYSFVHLLEHFRRTQSWSALTDAQVTSAYTSAWQTLCSCRHVARAMLLAPLLAVFTYTAGYDAWRDERQLQDAKTAAYLRSLTRRIKREAEQLAHSKEQIHTCQLELLKP